MDFYKDKYEYWANNVVPNLINELYNNFRKDNEIVNKQEFIRHLIEDIGFEVGDINCMVTYDQLVNICREDFNEYLYPEPDICDD